MNNHSISVKAGWLISLRLATYVLISGIVIYWMRFPEVLRTPFLAYSFLTLLLPFLLIMRRWINLRLLLIFIPMLQSLLEIAVETGIIYITGNINSAYSGLFILTIISAALTYGLVGTLSIAAVVSISYAYVVWFGLGFSGEYESATKALEAIFSSQDAGFYSIFLHILTFFLVAFVSGFLAERLRAKDVELADTSQALRRAKLETDDILRHLNSGLFTIDRDGHIIFFNRAAEEILGFAESGVRGRDIRDVFEGRMPRLIENLLIVLDSKKQSHRNEIDITNRKGRRVPLGISTSILKDDNDDIRGVIAIFQDLTETKKLEDKIRQADKMAAVGELSAAIAHEIRNPLAAISGSVEVLKGELSLSDENLRLMALIERETTRLNNILSDFLLYARSRRSTFTKIELCRLVGDVAEVIKHHPSYRDNVNLRILSSESFIYIFGDEDQLKQILMNLIVNACEAINDKSGEIIISLEINDKNEVLIKLVDNGPGIDESLRSKIFDPFFSTKKDGTGLGLAIVQRLAGNLNIGLSLHSEVNIGTAFTLNFGPYPKSTGNTKREKAKIASPA